MDVLQELYQTNVTKTTHTTPYPAISPTLPSLSQTGRTVLITGGATGIGLAIAHAFVQASASTVIIVGRRADKLAQASEELTAAVKQAGLSTNVVAQTCDVSDVKSIEALWDGFKEKDVVVDVLVSNAAKFANVAELLELGAEHVWSLFETNVKAPLFLAEKFYKQGADRAKAFINVSSNFVHLFQSKVMQGRLAYGLTKNSGTLVAQLVAQETPPEKVQVVSFHPGLVWSDEWPVEITKGMLPFTDVALSGHFAVWAASPEARFLHGRFVWSSWDVEDLKTGEVRERIDSDSAFLKIGVTGLRLGNLA
ncbi:hypothetical protein A1O3_05402 [Capronia epimyces CBS 606.96]|uniref:Uncharacterized protein n=1 Tax=Capronia epimyces CBS 606.96 TaxID=1182542 RepID=W9Y679_9EURO|nr:uncharacterized protein A1O3_05402 [Capronia epimyces CBS 606.96]EXJ84731.1 hypothetical protein A1O3_05402 [Capronia epimyces CBS 606.96]